jgi:hypothetical protein
LFSVTVQEIVPPGLTVAGAQVRSWSAGGATMFTVVWRELPFSDAVIAAVVSVVTGPAAAWNVAPADPAATNTDAGTVVPAPDPVCTDTPPAGAGAESVIVHVLTAPAFTVPGTQLRPATVTGG